MSKIKTIQMIPLALIEPDENQPRKSFNAERLSELMNSIKRHGIMTPLSVEKRPGGMYLLVDGERRYRASTELKLKEVPAIVEEPQDDVNRLIQQFHLQEQHEGWTALEKAVAVSSLSEQLNVNVSALADMLSLPRGSVSDYVSFSKLLERKHFEKSEVPILYASAIIRLKTLVKNSYLKNLNKEFSIDDQKSLERRVIDEIKKGNIAKSGDIAKLIDVVKINPTAIETFITGTTVDRVFTDSNAKVARHYRNIINNSRAISTHASSGIPLGIKKLFKDDESALKTLKNAREAINSIINLI